MQPRPRSSSLLCSVYSHSPRYFYVSYIKQLFIIIKLLLQFNYFSFNEIARPYIYIYLNMPDCIYICISDLLDIIIITIIKTSHYYQYYHNNSHYYHYYFLISVIFSRHSAFWLHHKLCATHLDIFTCHAKTLFLCKWSYATARVQRPHWRILYK